MLNIVLFFIHDVDNKKFAILVFPDFWRALWQPNSKKSALGTFSDQIIRIYLMLWRS